ncbi:MAG: MBL fold metallo-hydrolase [Firmicutes bacterium]|nr:MBL fold metallo-hydrolase [Bacillota bacterium]
MKKCFRLLSLLLCGMLFLSGCASGAPSQTLSAADEPVSVTFFDVGKADAILIQTEESVVMIDTGTADGAEELVGQLKELGISAIDILFISHFDQDHVGGAAQILSNFQVGKIYVTYLSKESDEIDAYLSALATTGVSEKVVQSRTELSLDGVNYTIIPPQEKDYGNNTSNDSSLVVKAVFGSLSFLFTGDIEKDRIQELLDAGEDLSCTVLKVPHHGGVEDNTKELIAACVPSYAVITCSDDEPEDEETLEYLTKQNVETWLTREGTVQISTDGQTVTVLQ